jgi:hypothetical protein
MRPEMLAKSLPVIPPAPKVHAKDLPPMRHLLTVQRNSIEIFPATHSKLSMVTLICLLALPQKFAI